MKKKINAGSVDELFEIVNAIQEGRDPEEYLNQKRAEQKAEAEAAAKAEAEAQKAAEEKAAAQKAAEEEKAAEEKRARKEEAAAKRAARRKEAEERIAARREEWQKSREEKRAAKEKEAAASESEEDGKEIPPGQEEDSEGRTERRYGAKTVSDEAENVGNRILRSLHMEQVDEGPSEEDVEELVKNLPDESGTEEAEETAQAVGTEEAEETAKAVRMEEAEETAKAVGTEETGETARAVGTEETKKAVETAGKEETEKAVETAGKEGTEKTAETAAAEEAKEPAEAKEPTEKKEPAGQAESFGKAESRKSGEGAAAQPEMADLMAENVPSQEETEEEPKEKKEHPHLASGIAAAAMGVLIVGLGAAAVLYQPGQKEEPETETEIVMADTVAPVVTAQKSGGTITISATDDDSGVDEIWYAAVDSGGLVEMPEYLEYTAPIPYQAGQTYYFYAVDQAGNQSDLAVTQMDTPSYPPVPGQATVTISAVGDCLLGSELGDSSAGSFPAYAYSYGDSYFFENVRDILENDDLTFANLEGPLTSTSAYQDNELIYRGDPSYTGILQDGSIEAVSLANDHTSDYGAKGLADTEEALTTADIGYCIDSTIDYQDVSGINVAFIGIYEQDLSSYEQDTQTAISSAQDNGAQLIIVAYHWGEDTATAPDETQREIAHAAVDMGADLVLGYHPNALQGIEKYNGRYIVYSLGNFCFGGSTSPSDYDTMIFRQTFVVDDSGVEENDDIEIIPCMISSTTEYNDFCPTPAAGEDADAIMQRINDYSAAFGDITYTASTGLS